MQKYLPVILLVLTVVSVSAQHSYVDSLQRKLNMAKEDTTKASLLEKLSKYYVDIQLDSAFSYAQQLVQLSQKLNYQYGEAIGFFYLSGALDREGNYPKALEIGYRCLHIAEKLRKNRNYVLSLAYGEISLLNLLTKDYTNAFVNLHRAVQFGEKSEINNDYLYHIYAFLSSAHGAINNLDSALFYARKAYRDVPGNEARVAFALGQRGGVYATMGDYEKAKDYFRLAIQKGREYHTLFHTAGAQIGLAALYKKTGSLDSCIYYAKDALALSSRYRYQMYTMRASSLLSQAFEAQGNTDSTLKYMKTMLAVKDSVFNQTNMQQYQLVAFEEQQRRQEAKAREERYRNQIKMYALLAALFVFLLIAVILYRNNQQKQKAKRKIEQAYEQLKATQAQLIQSEKMASLGELTAGIAHEIQNPLNFVNNFSDVNRELITEMKEEIDKGNVDEIKAIANDLEENEQKINHHGKRADAIVKGMLQHSRKSSDKKEPTDINALADEYLRLSYHGLRAKDKDFNANFTTNFDESVGKIDVTAQDIGRVLLNLYNNAFYFVNEKKKLLNGTFEPTVEVTTKRSLSLGEPGRNHAEGTGEVIISVKDNGTGITQKAVDKIFQPFFTTKPTGQGTGLGLSLSYDIIKAHGGEIKVETKEGEGAKFIIQLPC